jgi:hypothetical protein
MAKLGLLLVAALALASVATAMEAPPKPATTTMCSEFDCEAAGKVRRASAAFTQGNSVDGCCKDKATTCGDFDCKAEGKVRVKNAEKLHHADAASCCRDASTEAPCADYAGCDAKTEVLCKGAGKKKQGTKPKETCCVAKPAVMCDKYLNDDGVTSKCEKPTLLVLHPEKVAQNGDAKGNCCKDPKKLGKRLKKVREERTKGPEETGEEVEGGERRENVCGVPGQVQYCTVVMLWCVSWCACASLAASS